MKSSRSVKENEKAIDSQTPETQHDLNCPLREGTKPCGLLVPPAEILLLLADYFHTEVKYRNMLIFPFRFDWRNFMNTNSKYFGKWKRKSQLIQLYDEYSKLFLT
jgi:hypothetical protein